MASSQDNGGQDRTALRPFTEFAVDPATTTLLPWYYIQRGDRILQVLSSRIEKLKRI
ncbi:MAG: hypothetical protein KBD01_09110 [Acidobacteria bacterium]|nr:hypothetical protein [Acidobacteriota bacterium]